MDTKYIKIASGFAIGTVIGGIFTNVIVTSVFTGDSMNLYQWLLCETYDSACSLSHLTLYTIIIAASIILIGYIWNIIWWTLKVGQIKVAGISMPSRYPNSIGIDVWNDSNDDLLVFSVQPLYVKHKDFPSNLNTIDDVEYHPFVTRESLLALRKTMVGIIESFGNDDEGYKTKFLIEHEGFIVHHYYFPINQAVEKGDVDIYGQIYEMFIEVRGRIREGKFSRIYKGKFSHIIILEKWKRQKSRWIQRKPKYSSNINWIDFRGSSMKELKNAKRKSRQDKKNPSSAKAEIKTKEELWAELEPETGKKSIFTR